MALATYLIENELDEIETIKHLDSTSKAGFSTVSVELIDAVTDDNVEAIHSELRDALSDAAAQFPPEAFSPIYDDKRGAVATTLILALKWSDPDKDADSLGILTRQAEEISARLRRVGGTELVRI